MISVIVLVALISSTTTDNASGVERLFGVGIGPQGLLVKNRKFSLSTLNYYLAKMENNPCQFHITFSGVFQH